jgi:pimeloyl-ACP methyl ester carboxylesterase
VEKTTRAVFADQRLVNDAMIDRYYELLLYPGNRHATRLRASQPADPALIGKLGTIKAPTLILSGQKDTLAPVQTARMFHSRIPGSQLIEYPNVGHLPMEEIPDRSARDAREFLASTF